MKCHKSIITSIFLSLFLSAALAQDAGLNSINSSDLKAHMEFMASDELKGRDTGDPGLGIAARYLATRAGHSGLLQADSAAGYFQYFQIWDRAIDTDRSRIVVKDADGTEVLIPEPFYFFPMPSENKIEIEGEVVFAGYGIRDEAFGYDDFANIDLKDKIVLVMTRGPMNEDGSEMLFDHAKWNDPMSMRHKLPLIYSQGPRAVLLVNDPKSGNLSVDDAIPWLGDYLSRKRKLKTNDERPSFGMTGGKVKTVLVHTSVANRLLESCGKTLAELQEGIDKEKEENSFLLENTKVKISLEVREAEVEVSNVFAYIEGSDPELKDEMVIYLAHYDHIGTNVQGEVYNGADDNASGTVALLEIAEAFQAEEKPPARSVGFLWVSAEEIGLYGSKYYADHPLVPMEQTAAAINLDMVGRVRMSEDDLSGRKDLTIAGRDSVKVIGGLQSKVLMKINEKTLKDIGLVGNYEFNNRNDPKRYFYRSDHISFARKDIPVLFYSTGTHRDYHRPTDDEALIDYDKFLMMTKFSFLVGWRIANFPRDIEVDNPMSEW